MKYLMRFIAWGVFWFYVGQVSAMVGDISPEPHVYTGWSMFWVAINIGCLIAIGFWAGAEHNDNL